MQICSQISPDLGIMRACISATGTESCKLGIKRWNGKDESAVNIPLPNELFDALSVAQGFRAVPGARASVVLTIVLLLCPVLFLGQFWAALWLLLSFVLSSSVWLAVLWPTIPSARLYFGSGFPIVTPTPIRKWALLGTWLFGTRKELWLT